MVVLGVGAHQAEPGPDDDRGPLAPLLASYRDALTHWNKILARPKAQTREGLAAMLADDEKWFIVNRGGLGLGQEIMAITGVLADECRVDREGVSPTARARHTFFAIMHSACSADVRGEARRQAIASNLVSPDEAPDNLPGCWLR